METFEGDFKYTVENNKASITDYAGNDENLIVPAKLEGYAVTAIAEKSFESCQTLQSIKIPDSVTSIEDDAFYGCENLVSIEIPNSVISIGKDAFYYCKNLATVKISDSITNIGMHVFLDVKI